MAGFTFIGIIAGNRWRVTEQDFYSETIDDTLELIMGPLTKKLDAIKKGVKRCQFTSDVNQLSAGEKGFGRWILSKIVDLPEDATLYLSDNHDALSSEAYCDRAFIINLDSDTLSCYHRGKKFMFGRYDLNNLPDADQIAADYEMSVADAGFEAWKLTAMFMETAIRRKHAEDGTDPEPEIKQFWEEMREIYDSEQNF